LIENKHIAYCGLDCMKCPAYIAKRENDDKLRRETAEKWNKAYNLGLKPEQIDCDGCLTENIGNNNCVIRVCSRGKGLMNCAYCREYICKKLAKYFQTAPGCKDSLDQIREKKGMKSH
jgi:hypothetical protein